MPEDTSIYEETLPTVEEPDLLQEDVEMARVPVEVRGDVTTYLLPCRRVQTGTDLVSDTTTIEVLAATNKRARALLISIDGPMQITSGSSSPTVWPQNVAYEVRHTGSIRVKALTAASTT